MQTLLPTEAPTRRFGESTADFLERHRTQLPKSPQILTDLQAMMDSGVTGAKEIAAVLKRDPGLTATLLRIVNSAFYGLPRQVARPTVAVAYLGTEEIHRLVVAASVMKSFEKVDPQALGAYWRFSYISALTARQLVTRHARLLSRSRAWTYGLLHDLGALVMLSLSPDHFREREAYRAHAGCLPDTAERALGLEPSASFGALLCEQWLLPETFEAVCHAVPRGGAPDDCDGESAEYIRLVCAASRLAHLVSSQLADGVVQRLSDEVRELLDVDDVGMDLALADAHEARDEAERSVAEMLG